MSDDIQEFIDDEETKLDNLLAGLDPPQLRKYLPKVQEIEFLLQLLAELPKKEQDEVEDKIKKDTAALTKDSRAEQLRLASNMSIVKKVKPNIDSIPEEVRQKALMTRASTLYSQNGQDKDLTDAFLEDNAIPFRVDDELSTTEGLVLSEVGNPENVKIAYRGSKMNNLNDWVSNAKILAGYEKTGALNEDRFNETFDQFEKVKAKYGNVSELMGHSRGGTLAMTVGDKYSVDTTTFNPFLGRNLVRASESNATHNLYRTTEDISSMGLGFRSDTSNIKTNVIRPLAKNKGPVPTHRLDNFTDNGARSKEDVLHDLIKDNATKGAKHGESILLGDMANYLEGEDNVLSKPDNYGFESDKQPRARDRTSEITGYDPLEFDYEYRTGPPELGPARVKQPKGGRFLVDDPFMPQQSDLDAAYADLGDLNDMRHDAGSFNEIRQKQQADIGNPRVAKKPSALQTVKDKAMQMKLKLDQLSENIKNKTKMKNRTRFIDTSEIQVEIPTAPVVPESKSFTGFIEKFSPADAKNGFVRLHNKARMVKAWKELGGDFTEKEKAFLDKPGVEDDPFHLSKSERDEIYDSTPQERESITNDYHDDVVDAIKSTDEYTSVMNEQGTKSATVTGQISENFNPVGLGIGLVSGYTANKLVDSLDPNNRLPEEAKTLASGALGQIGSDIAIAQLGGEALTAGSLGVSGLAGGAGALASYETYKGLKKAGASDFEATTGAGTSGGLAAAITAGVSAGLIGSAPLDVETLGTAGLVGGGTGALIGGGSYIAGELDQTIENKVKKAGGSNLEAKLAGYSSVGSALGTLLLPGLGTVAGGVAGASVAGLMSLGGYLKGKIF